MQEEEVDKHIEELVSRDNFDMCVCVVCARLGVYRSNQTLSHNITACSGRSCLLHL